MTDRRKIESILREPLTRHRFSLNSKLRAAQDAEKPEPFTLEDLKAFFAGIKTNAIDFQQEVLNVLEAVQAGLAPQKPRFDTPEKQLIWGAAFAYLKLNPDVMKTWKHPVAEPGPLKETELWKQVVNTSAIIGELSDNGTHVQEALRDKAIRYDWSEPGTGFTYNRAKNIIDVDLMQAMIVGFEHARADVYREIGHALLSVTYTKRMQQLSREMQPLLQKSRKASAKKGPKLQPEEYKKLRMLSAEWQLRYMMFNAAEENVANKFVSNMGQQMLQDYSVSLNNTAVTHRAIGLTRLPADKNASEELRRYMNLCNTVQLSFFQNNELFDDTDSGWVRVGVDPNMVRKTATLAKRPDDAKDDADGISHADFQHLRELCGGPNGLENLQPKQHERLYGLASLMGRVNRADLERKAIIEEILKLYGEDLIQKILTQANDQVDQQLKEAKDKQQQKGDDKEDGEEQENDDQDGEPQEVGQSGGKPQKGKKGKKSKKGKQQGEPQDADDMDEDGEQSEDQKGDKKDQKDKKDGEKGDQKGKGAEGKLGADDEDKVPVEGAGDMPNVEKPSDVPSDEADPSAGKDGESKDADGDAKTAEELEKEAKEAEEAEDAENDGDDADGDDADGKGKKKGKGKPNPGAGKEGAGHGDGRSLSDLAKQDWKDYPKRIAELSGPIQRVRKIFKEVQKRQLQRKVVQSKSMDILPENGELKERFNVDAHRSLTIKKLTGGVEENDLKRFYRDESKFTPTEIDIVIMIDGSGSMGQASYSGSGSGSSPSPLQSALQASAILFEAAAGKDMKMNVYVGMWGDSNPPIMIKPGDDRITIGKAMEKMRQGLNSGTDFAPAVEKVAEVIGDQRGRSGTLSGLTHVLVISDGDMVDIAHAKEKMNIMFECSDKVTFDVAIITASKNTQMENMAKGMAARKPFQKVGVVLEKDPNKVPMAIVELLLKKVQEYGSFTAVPNSKKRRAMKKAHNRMDKKP